MAESYGRQLETAERAARAAGEMLREEFHREGGPRGGGEHADIDEVAEAAIHEVLSTAYPEYGYLGEELGALHAPRDAGRHTWLVDPNDATSSFLKGFRGASVSIALLRAGRPVLGVVFAYCAPDDRGDFICWAEGVGPVRRNGSESPRVWPAAWDAEHTILLSHGSNLYPRANAELLAPARFISVPSIAYRLALAAAGEGDAALSLNGPVGWDYGGGHAILLGAGGDLYDRRGEPVVYSEDGRSDCGGYCFGGPRGLARELAQREWERAYQRATGDPDGRILCRPLRGAAITDADVLARAQGCVLGQVAGDSLGSLVEFESTERIRQRYPHGVTRLADGGPFDLIAGQPTDDSEMALALARSIIAAGTYDAARAMDNYVAWYRSHPFDIGMTTRRALRGASPDPESQSNGALMRVSPIGVAGAFEDSERVAEWARADAALTHPHAVCRDANAAYAVAVARAVRTGEGRESIFEFALSAAKTAEVRQALECARTAAPQCDGVNIGWVLVALQNAFHELLRAESFEAGVVETVMRGGDTDTNAAIAGALLGALFGREAVPAQWRNRVLSCRAMSRPETYWPVDILNVAERLLLCGRP